MASINRRRTFLVRASGQVMVLAASALFLTLETKTRLLTQLPLSYYMFLLAVLSTGLGLFPHDCVPRNYSLTFLQCRYKHRNSVSPITYSWSVVPKRQMDSVTHSSPLQSNTYFCIFENKIPEKQLKGIKVYFSSQQSSNDGIREGSVQVRDKASDEVQWSVPNESLPPSRLYLVKAPMLQNISNQRLGTQNVIQLGIIQITIITASLF